MGLPENIRAIINHLIEPTRFYGFYLYEVTGFTGADPLNRRPDLTPVDLPDRLPPLRAVDRIPGFTGAAEGIPARTPLERGALVLVGFRGGNDALPFVAFTLPTTPEFLDVYIGGAGRVSVHAVPEVAPPSPVAIASKVIAWKTALDTYLAAIQTAVNNINPTQGAALLTALTAYQGATGGIGGQYPAGMAARKLSTE